MSSQKEEGQSLAAAVAPGCETFCTSGSGGFVLVYDANTHAKIRTLEPRSVIPGDTEMSKNHSPFTSHTHTVSRLH